MQFLTNLRTFPHSSQIYDAFKVLSDTTLSSLHTAMKCKYKLGHFKLMIEMIQNKLDANLKKIIKWQ